MKIKLGEKEFEVSDEVISKALEAKTEVTIDGSFVIRTTEEEERYLSNIKGENKVAGLEMAIKEKRKELGLDFEGKTIDNLLESYSKKVLADAKIEPTEQLAKVNKQLEEKQKALDLALQEKLGLENNFKSFKSESVIDRTLDSLIPENTILPKEDMKVLLRTKMKFDVNENGISVIGSDGEVMKNKTTADPLAVKDVISDFFKTNQNYIKGVQGGAGGSDSGKTTGKQTLDEFITEQNEKGVKVNSPEFTAELNNRTKAELIDLG